MTEEEEEEEKDEDEDEEEDGLSTCMIELIHGRAMKRQKGR